jgi:uncharacterized protein YcaQ
VAAPVSLSIAQARRIALAAQGFTDKRPTGRVDRRHLRRVLDRIGVIQIDSVNVLVRSQELPLFARLGPHPRTLIDDATRDGELFEYWVHVASHAPVELHPLLRWRMDERHHWKGLREFRERHPGYIEDVLRRVREDGPVVAGDLQQRVGPKGAWWDWDDGKLALELLFQSGEVACRRRPNDFARVYDVAERVIPREILDLPTPDPREARKALLLLAARHHGVGTDDDLADYHRLKTLESRSLLRELVEEGQLLDATVDGWDKPAFLHPGVTRPRRVEARALLSPFDPVVWYRDRARRLFDFEYRIEIYTPKAKRVHGYYVLPFLLGDRLVARVDAKADRANGLLLVPGAFAEPGVDPPEVAEGLAGELRSMAGWLGLHGGVEVGTRGDLARPLSAALASARGTTPIG